MTAVEVKPGLEPFISKRRNNSLQVDRSSNQHEVNVPRKLSMMLCQGEKVWTAVKIYPMAQ